MVDAYGPKSGIVVSPFVPFVRSRVARLMQEWRTNIPADCLFFDQIGARQWIRDFNRASANPLAYYDGWVAVMGPYSDRCLMAEDGWDRLARDFTGFHGSMLMMDREHGLPDKIFGEGNWEPYPLCHVALPRQGTALPARPLRRDHGHQDDEVLAWNMAFGLISSYSWNEWTDSLRSPWLDVVGDLQRSLGPHYAGVRLTGYRDVAPNVTESTFGDLVVLANWDSAAGHAAGGYGISPSGFFARTRDDRLLAGAFEGTFDGPALSEGTHYLIMERDNLSVTVRQPLGADTNLAIEPPSSWRPGQSLKATAIDPDGKVVVGKSG